MNHRRYILVTLGLALALTGAVAATNWFIDPQWCYPADHAYNRLQAGTNERQQKLNYLSLHDDEFDALLVGSSRVSFMPASALPGRVANLAVSSMHITDLQKLIEAAKKISKRKIEVIYIGLDFFTANSKPLVPFDVKLGPFSCARNLPSFSLLGESITNIAASRSSYVESYFTRSMERVRRPVTAAQFKEIATAQIPRTSKNFLPKTLKRNPAYRETLRKIIDDNPGIRFVAFATPTARPMISIMKQNGIEALYEQWLTDIVEEFGEFTDFTGPNSVNAPEVALANFSDINHYLPHVGELIAKRISKRDQDSVPADFGVLVTKDSIGAHLAARRAAIAESVPLSPEDALRQILDRR